MTTRKMVGTAWLLVFVSSTTLACQAPEKWAKFQPACVAVAIENADQNEDGRIDRFEAATYLQAMDLQIRKRISDGVDSDKVGEAIADVLDMDFISRFSSTTPPRYEPPYLEMTIGDFSETAIVRSVALFRTMEKPKETPLGPRITASRKVGDAVNPRGGGWIPAAPFIVSIADNRETGKASAVLQGRLAFGPFDLDRDPTSNRWLGQAIVDLDVDTTKTSDKTNIGIGYASTFTSTKFGVFDEVAWTVTPLYETDRDATMDVVSVRSEFAFRKKSLWGAGYWRSPNFGTGGQTFAWLPRVAMVVGDVRDPSNRPELAAIQATGSYTRLEPAIDFLYDPSSVDPGWSFRASYRHTYDLSEGWDRGLGEVGAYYDLGKENLQFSIIYQKGRKGVAFTPVETVLVGIGIRQ